ncbi:putative transcription factor B3-Domain family [Lupinus albus]|uniref:Putative transcription factor B3-Domain family n=1 Tax=Lupinus albus TaxID=3870 RepID=A0A6A4PCB7_LUPAL|nr:putative transcription factor B3-Domain family [Lupinus albus]
MAYLPITHEFHNICTNLTLGACPNKKGKACPSTSSSSMNASVVADGINRGRNNEAEERVWGYSMELKLYDDPWKIKKVMTESDLGHLSRFLLPKEMAEDLVLSVLSLRAQREAMTERGTTIMIWDIDTSSMHSLVFKKWLSSRSYVFLDKWNQSFVKRRNLQKGDEIGLHWDPSRDCFNFSVLRRYI